jgi:hypothetical protein
MHAFMTFANDSDGNYNVAKTKTIEMYCSKKKIIDEAKATLRSTKFDHTDADKFILSIKEVTMKLREATASNWITEEREVRRCVFQKLTKEVKDCVAFRLQLQYPAEELDEILMISDFGSILELVRQGARRQCWPEIVDSVSFVEGGSKKDAKKNQRDGNHDSSKPKQKPVWSELQDWAKSFLIVFVKGGASGDEWSDLDKVKASTAATEVKRVGNTLFLAYKDAAPAAAVVDKIQNLRKFEIRSSNFRSGGAPRGSRRQ